MLDPNLPVLIRLALREDLGRAGDLTTRCFIPPKTTLRGGIVAKKPGVVCGLEAARRVFRTVSPAIRFRPAARDGQRVRRGQVVAWVQGPAALLTAERTALNFLQRLSGVATLTRAFVDAARGTRARILDTRKTLPGWRALDKYAVRCGGGQNHRLGLYDMVMLKDNHWEGLARDARRTFPRSVGARPSVSRPFFAAVSKFRKAHRGVPVLIEAKTRREVDLALGCRADIILLDNMPPARLRREIAHIRARAPRALIEVSGGVRLATVRAIARLGPDRISIGALTHSAPALDFSLEIGLKR